MRALLFLIAFLTAFPAPVAPALAAEDPAQYVRRLLGDMVAVSKRPTRERRQFYVGLLTGEVDWNGPALQALGSRWQSLPDGDRQKLAAWSRDAVLETDSVMNFVQNLIFQSCAIASRSQEGARASVRISCARFGGEPNFIVRFEVTKNGEANRITDVGYNGISLREALGKELFTADAVARHGVRVDGVAVKN